MDHYHIWVNLRPGVKDLDFCDRVVEYMEHLRGRGAIEGHTLTPRQLGFGPGDLGEFHIGVHVRDLAQLDESFRLVASRSGVLETLHAAVHSCVTDFTAASYRHVPDPMRTPSAPRPGVLVHES